MTAELRGGGEFVHKNWRSRKEYSLTLLNSYIKGALITSAGLPLGPWYLGNDEFWDIIGYTWPEAWCLRHPAEPYPELVLSIIFRYFDRKFRSSILLIVLSIFSNFQVQTTIWKIDKHQHFIQGDQIIHHELQWLQWFITKSKQQQ